MKRFAFLLLTLAGFWPTAALALTAQDQAALRQITREYAEWDFTGRPVHFREKLDYDSYEEQRHILLQFAGRVCAARGVGPEWH